jgi:hypothetical protein
MPESEHALNINHFRTLSHHSHERGEHSAGDMSMWNSKKYLTIALVGAGLGVAAASPASAQCGMGWGGAYGAAYGGGGCGGWGGAYGAAGGYGGWGSGWGGYGYPVTYVLVPTYSGWGGYGGWGGTYGSAGWGGYGGGWGGAYGSAGWGGSGWGGAYGWGCRSHHHHRAAYGGYAVASLPRHIHSNVAVAAFAPRLRHSHALYASVRSMKHHMVASVKRNVRFG